MRRIRTLAAAAAALAALALPAAAPAEPIPQTDESDAPAFQGGPATQRPVAFSEPPRHPFMAPNERSNLHVDAYQTDVHTTPGPLGRDMRVTSTRQFADCASVTFDSRGRIVTACVGLQGPRLMMMDPHTLDTLATFTLPPRQPGAGNVFADFAGGGYFYLDHRDRAIIPTTTRHIYVVRQPAGGEPGFELERDFDLSATVPPGDKIISALPDWSGRLWIASTEGVVATLDLESGAVRSFDMREANGNSFAVDDDGGVYIVSTKALYRFEAAADGTPTVVWREEYANDGTQKPGQASPGSGTTPTIMEGGLVAITDNANPINVVVYRRGARVDGPRAVCTQPVFEQGASATDNSLIAAGRSIVVENNHGYTGPASTEQGRTTKPGIERVDLDRDGEGCRRVWHSDEISPTVVPKLSAPNGLVYAYTHPEGDRADPWYLTAIDFHTGKTVFRQRAGSGLGFNNNYAPITIGPDGTAYVGVLGGLVALRDATPPPRPGSSPGERRGLRLKLRLSYRHGPGCARGRVRASVGGTDRGRVRSAVFYVGRRRAATDRRPPLSRKLRLPRRGRAYSLSARVTLTGGDRLTLPARVRSCGRR